MSTNRLLYVLIVIALVAVAAMSLQQVVTTKAAGQAQGSAALLKHPAPKSIQVDRSYDQVESVRASGSIQADRSYDSVESMRSNRIAPASAAKGLSIGPTKKDPFYQNEADRARDLIEPSLGKRAAPASSAKDLSCPDGECSYQLSNGQWVK